MQFDFLEDYSIPEIPKLPPSILLAGGEEASELFIKMHELSKSLDCSLPIVEFALGGFEYDESANPIRSCDKCKETNVCPAWSLNRQRWRARCTFEYRMKACEKAQILEREKERSSLKTAAKKAKEFAKAYQELLKFSGGNESFLQQTNIKTKQPVHINPTITQILDMSKILNSSASTSYLARTQKPDLRGGKNLQAHFLANRIGVLFRLLGRNITHGPSPITGQPGTAFGRAVQQAFAIFDVESDWDDQTRRVSKVMGKKT